MVTRGRFLDDDHELTDRARHWIDGVQAQFASVPIGEQAPADQARTVRLQDALMQMLPFSFRAIEELELGSKWAAVFEERWPHYREWFLREGEDARPSYAESARMLREHMPELMASYERVVELAGGGDLAARMLSLYRPPPYLAACSQGVWSREGAPCLFATTTTRPRGWKGSSGRPDSRNAVSSV